MIVTTLIAATVAAQTAPPVLPATAVAPAAEKEMACCEKMAKGDSCDCCKGNDGNAGQGMKDGGHDGRANHDQ